MKNELPKPLFRKGYMLNSVIFVLLFSIVFMAVYQPFSATAWISFVPERNLYITLLFYMVCLVAMFFSKQALFWVQNNFVFGRRTLAAWVLSEFVVIALIYAVFTSVFFGMSITPMLVLRISFSVALILAIPYAFVIIYAQYQSKREELELLKLQRHNRPSSEEQLVRLYDSNGVLKLSINEGAIYYVESQDNYVQIYYDLDDKLHSYMLRCRTQRLEEMLIGTSLVRCHRSYIVNLKRVKFFKNEHDHGTITLSHASAKPIPVSKSYYKVITELIA